MTDKNDKPKIGPLRMQRISWRDLASSLGLVLLLSAVAIWIAFHFVRPAPPDTITMASGPEGSTLWNYAERYRKILARNGVKLKILPSEGTLDNLSPVLHPGAAVRLTGRLRPVRGPSNPGEPDWLALAAQEGRVGDMDGERHGPPRGGLAFDVENTARGDRGDIA